MNVVVCVRRLFSRRPVANAKRIVACTAFRFGFQSGPSNGDFPPKRTKGFLFEFRCMEASLFCMCPASCTGMEVRYGLLFTSTGT